MTSKVTGKDTIAPPQMPPPVVAAEAPSQKAGATPGEVVFSGYQGRPAAELMKAYKSASLEWLQPLANEYGITLDALVEDLVATKVSVDAAGNLSGAKPIVLPGRAAVLGTLEAAAKAKAAPKEAAADIAKAAPLPFNAPKSEPDFKKRLDAAQAKVAAAGEKLKANPQDAEATAELKAAAMEIEQLKPYGAVFALGVPASDTDHSVDDYTAAKKDLDWSSKQKLSRLGKGHDIGDRLKRLGIDAKEVERFILFGEVSPKIAETIEHAKHPPANTLGKEAQSYHDAVMVSLFVYDAGAMRLKADHSGGSKQLLKTLEGSKAELTKITSAFYSKQAKAAEQSARASYANSEKLQADAAKAKGILDSKDASPADKAKAQTEFDRASHAALAAKKSADALAGVLTTGLNAHAKSARKSGNDAVADKLETKAGSLNLLVGGADIAARSSGLVTDLPPVVPAVRNEKTGEIVTESNVPGLEAARRNLARVKDKTTPEWSDVAGRLAKTDAMSAGVALAKTSYSSELSPDQKKTLDQINLIADLAERQKKAAEFLGTVADARLQGLSGLPLEKRAEIRALIMAKAWGNVIALEHFCAGADAVDKQPKLSPEQRKLQASLHVSRDTQLTIVQQEVAVLEAGKKRKDDAAQQFLGLASELPSLKDAASDLEKAKKAYEKQIGAKDKRERVGVDRSAESVSRDQMAKLEYDKAKLSAGMADRVAKKEATTEELLKYKADVAEIDRQIAGIGLDLAADHDPKKATDARFAVANKKVSQDRDVQKIEQAAARLEEAQLGADAAKRTADKAAARASSKATVGAEVEADLADAGFGAIRARVEGVYAKYASPETKKQVEARNAQEAALEKDCDPARATVFGDRAQRPDRSVSLADRMGYATVDLANQSLDIAKAMPNDPETLSAKADMARGAIGAKQGIGRYFMAKAISERMSAKAQEAEGDGILKQIAGREKQKASIESGIKFDEALATAANVNVYSNPLLWLPSLGAYAAGKTPGDGVRWLFDTDAARRALGRVDADITKDWGKSRLANHESAVHSRASGYSELEAGKLVLEGVSDLALYQATVAKMPRDAAHDGYRLSGVQLGGGHAVNAAKSGRADLAMTALTEADALRDDIVDSDLHAIAGQQARLFGWQAAGAISDARRRGALKIDAGADGKPQLHLGEAGVSEKDVAALGKLAEKVSKGAEEELARLHSKSPEVLAAHDAASAMQKEFQDRQVAYKQMFAAWKTRLTEQQAAAQWKLQSGLRDTKIQARDSVNWFYDAITLGTDRKLIDDWHNDDALDSASWIDHVGSRGVGAINDLEKQYDTLVAGGKAMEAEALMASALGGMALSRDSSGVGKDYFASLPKGLAEGLSFLGAHDPVTADFRFADVSQMPGNVKSDTRMPSGMESAAAHFDAHQQWMTENAKVIMLSQELAVNALIIALTAGGGGAAAGGNIARAGAQTASLSARLGLLAARGGNIGRMAAQLERASLLAGRAGHLIEASTWASWIVRGGRAAGLVEKGWVSAETLASAAHIASGGAHMLFTMTWQGWAQEGFSAAVGPNSQAAKLGGGLFNVLASLELRRIASPYQSMNLTRLQEFGRWGKQVALSSSDMLMRAGIERTKERNPERAHALEMAWHYLANPLMVSVSGLGDHKKAARDQARGELEAMGLSPSSHPQAYKMLSERLYLQHYEGSMRGPLAPADHIAEQQKLLADVQAFNQKAAAEGKPQIPEKPLLGRYENASARWALARAQKALGISEHAPLGEAQLTAIRTQVEAELQEHSPKVGSDVLDKTLAPLNMRVLIGHKPGEPFNAEQAAALGRFHEAFGAELGAEGSPMALGAAYAKLAADHGMPAQVSAAMGLYAEARASMAKSAGAKELSPAALHTIALARAHLSEEATPAQAREAMEKAATQAKLDPALGKKLAGEVAQEAAENRAAGELLRIGELEQIALTAPAGGKLKKDALAALGVKTEAEVPAQAAKKRAQVVSTLKEQSTATGADAKRVAEALRAAIDVSAQSELGGAKSAAERIDLYHAALERLGKEHGVDAEATAATERFATRELLGQVVREQMQGKKAPIDDASLDAQLPAGMPAEQKARVRAELVRTMFESQAGAALGDHLAGKQEAATQGLLDAMTAHKARVYSAGTDAAKIKESLTELEAKLKAPPASLSTEATTSLLSSERAKAAQALLSDAATAKLAGGSEAAKAYWKELEKTLTALGEPTPNKLIAEGHAAIADKYARGINDAEPALTRAELIAKIEGSLTKLGVELSEPLRKQIEKHAESHVQRQVDAAAPLERPAEPSLFGGDIPHVYKAIGGLPAAEARAIKTRMDRILASTVDPSQKHDILSYFGELAQNVASERLGATPAMRAKNLERALGLFETLKLTHANDLASILGLFTRHPMTDNPAHNARLQEVNTKFFDELPRLLAEVKPAGESQGRAILQLLRRTHDLVLARAGEEAKLAPHPQQIEAIAKAMAKMKPDDAAMLHAALATGSDSVMVLGLLDHYQAALSSPNAARDAVRAVAAVAALGSRRDALEVSQQLINKLGTAPKEAQLQAITGDKLQVTALSKRLPELAALAGRPGFDQLRTEIAAANVSAPQLMDALLPGLSSAEKGTLRANDIDALRSVYFALSANDRSVLLTHLSGISDPTERLVAARTITEQFVARAVGSKRPSLSEVITVADGVRAKLRDPNTRGATLKALAEQPLTLERDGKVVEPPKLADGIKLQTPEQVAVAARHYAFENKEMLGAYLRDHPNGFSALREVFAKELSQRLPGLSTQEITERANVALGAMRELLLAESHQVVPGLTLVVPAGHDPIKVQEQLETLRAMAQAARKAGYDFSAEQQVVYILPKGVTDPAHLKAGFEEGASQGESGQTVHYGDGKNYFTFAHIEGSKEVGGAASGVLVHEFGHVLLRTGAIKVDQQQFGGSKDQTLIEWLEKVHLPSRPEGASGYANHNIREFAAEAIRAFVTEPDLLLARDPKLHAVLSKFFGAKIPIPANMKGASSVGIAPSAEPGSLIGPNRMRGAEPSVGEAIKRTLARPDFKPDHLLDAMSEAPMFQFLLDSPAGVSEGYTLREHTRMVMGQFEHYLGTVDLPRGLDRNFMRVVLSLHDIGKPFAAAKGDTSRSFEETSKIIDDMRAAIPLSDRDLRIARTMIKGDLLGDFIRHKATLEQTKERLQTLAAEAGLEPQELFKLLTVYYQSDASSYTKDAGGLAALDRLFVHDPATKRFKRDAIRERLTFNSEVETAFVALESAVERLRPKQAPSAVATPPPPPKARPKPGSIDPLKGPHVVHEGLGSGIVHGMGNAIDSKVTTYSAVEHAMLTGGAVSLVTFELHRFKEWGNMGTLGAHGVGNAYIRATAAELQSFLEQSGFAGAVVTHQGGKGFRILYNGPNQGGFQQAIQGLSTDKSGAAFKSALRQRVLSDPLLTGKERKLVMDNQEPINFYMGLAKAPSGTGDALSQTNQLFHQSYEASKLAQLGSAATIDQAKSAKRDTFATFDLNAAEAMKAKSPGHLNEMAGFGLEVSPVHKRLSDIRDPWSLAPEDQRHVFLSGEIGETKSGRLVLRGRHMADAARLDMLERIARGDKTPMEVIIVEGGDELRIMRLEANETGHMVLRDYAIDINDFGAANAIVRHEGGVAVPGPRTADQIKAKIIDAIDDALSEGGSVTESLRRANYFLYTKLGANADMAVTGSITPDSAKFTKWGFVENKKIEPGATGKVTLGGVAYKAKVLPNEGNVRFMLLERVDKGEPRTVKLAFVTEPRADGGESIKFKMKDLRTSLSVGGLTVGGADINIRTVNGQKQPVLALGVVGAQVFAAAEKMPSPNLEGFIHAVTDAYASHIKQQGKSEAITSGRFQYEPRALIGEMSLAQMAADPVFGPTFRNLLAEVYLRPTKPARPEGKLAALTKAHFDSLAEGHPDRETEILVVNQATFKERALAERWEATPQPGIYRTPEGKYITVQIEPERMSPAQVAVVDTRIAEARQRLAAATPGGPEAVHLRAVLDGLETIKKSGALVIDLHHSTNSFALEGLEKTGGRMLSAKMLRDMGITRSSGEGDSFSGRAGDKADMFFGYGESGIGTGAAYFELSKTSEHYNMSLLSDAALAKQITRAEAALKAWPRIVEGGHVELMGLIMSDAKLQAMIHSLKGEQTRRAKLPPELRKTAYPVMFALDGSGLTIKHRAKREGGLDEVLLPKEADLKEQCKRVYVPAANIADAKAQLAKVFGPDHKIEVVAFEALQLIMTDAIPLAAAEYKYTFDGVGSLPELQNAWFDIVEREYPPPRTQGARR